MHVATSRSNLSNWTPELNCVYSVQAMYPFHARACLASSDLQRRRLLRRLLLLQHHHHTNMQLTRAVAYARIQPAMDAVEQAVCLCVVSLVAWRRAVALMSFVCKTSLFFPIALIAALLFALLLLKLRFVLGYSEKYDFSRNVRISVP